MSGARLACALVLGLVARGLAPAAQEELDGLRRVCSTTRGWARLQARVSLARELEVAVGRLPAGSPQRCAIQAERATLLGRLGCSAEALEALEDRLRAPCEPGERSGTLFAAAEAARRCDRRHRAIELYREFLEGFVVEGNDVEERSASRRRRDEARAWLARLLAETGQREEARRRWRALTIDPADVLTGIDAFDRLALDALDDADSEAAAGWLHAARVRFAELGKELTPNGERVRRALVGMRAVDALTLHLTRRELESARSNRSPW